MTCTTSIWDEKVEQIYEVNDKVCKSERKNKFLLGFFPFGFVLDIDNHVVMRNKFNCYVGVGGL